MKIQFIKEFVELQCSKEVDGIVFLNFYEKNSFDDLHLVFFCSFSFAVLAYDPLSSPLSSSVPLLNGQSYPGRFPCLTLMRTRKNAT